MKYRKKPVIIDAWKLDRNDAMPDFILNAVNDNTIIIRTDKKSSSPFDHSYTKLWYEIKTLEGTMVANEGDYIIQGVNGEYYPCKPDIFEKTYEKVEESITGTITLGQEDTSDSYRGITRAETINPNPNNIPDISGTRVISPETAFDYPDRPKSDNFKKAEWHWYDPTPEACKKCSRYKECRGMNAGCEHSIAKYC